jgi:hypothetical protein
MSYRRIRSAPVPTTAGYVVAVHGGRVFLVDRDPGRDDGRISIHEARELAQRLLHAASTAERDQTRRVKP